MEMYLKALDNIKKLEKWFWESCSPCSIKNQNKGLMN
jgi:hypothetical protein